MRQQLTQTKLQLPKIPVLHNVDTQSHQTIPAIREVLVKQLVSPVKWVATIQALTAVGVTQVVECGPGKVLAGLNKRIDRNIRNLALTDGDAIKQAIPLLSHEG